MLSLAGKAAWALSGCLTKESADHCMFVNEWAWLMSQVCILRMEVDLGSGLESKLGQNGDVVHKSMNRLKVVSSEKYFSFKGFSMAFQQLLFSLGNLVVLAKHGGGSGTSTTWLSI